MQIPNRPKIGYKLAKSCFGNYEQILDNWELMPLDALLNIKMGQSPDSANYNTDKGGLPFFQGVSDFGPIKPVPSIWCKLPLRIATKDEILFSVRAPVGEVNLIDYDC